jgi:signal peptide peptidase SppA
MTLLDLLRSPWAILPDRLVEMQAIYATHLRGEKIDLPAIEARLGRPLANEQQDYEVRQGGVAVLTIEGALAPKANLFMRVSGGASTQMLTKQVESAVADPRVRALVLAIDSPGGSTIGSPELAAAVRELSAIKPIVTVTDGALASAAYWIGSAANAVFASGPTVTVGSIGVVVTHSYSPQASSQQITEITAGRYKRMASGGKPLDAEGQAYMQQMVDHLYGVFVDAVADHRGVSAADVLQHMADGRVFVGQQALDVGLIDGFATVDAIVERLATNPLEFSKRRAARLPASAPQSPRQKPAGVQASGTNPAEPVLLDSLSQLPMKGPLMTKDELAQQHPELLATIQADATAQASATASTAERERIQAVMAVGAGLPGHGALLQTLAFDGKTTAPEAAMAVLQAEVAARGQAIKAHDADAPKPVASSTAPSDQALSAEQQTTQAKAHAREHGVSFVAALKALGFAA